MAKRIDSLRAQITKLQAEQSTLTGTACNRDEARGIVEQWAAARATEGEALLRRSVERLAHTGAVDTRPFVAGVDRPSDLSPLLAAVVGAPALAAALLAHVEAVLPDALDAKGRALRLAEIERALDAAETEEERLVCESELTDSPILRRADVRPEIVLGVPA